MKNYKHAVKSASAMKLAAVASSAIMLAPVAMNSVSSFAQGTFAGNGAEYPTYNVFSYDAALKSGTTGAVTEPFTGFNTADIQAALDALAAIQTGANTNKTAIQSTYDAARAAGNKAQSEAKKLNDDVQNTSAGSIYKQLTTENQKNVATPALKTIKDKFTAIKTGKTALDDALKDALATADLTAENGASDKDQAKAAAKLQVFNDAVAAYKTNIAKYNDFVSAVKKYAYAVERLTNNGVVAQAARNAAKAISKMPVDKQPAAKQEFLKIQGIYSNATETINVQVNGATVNAQNVAKLNAAANTAVNALNALAGESHDNTDTTRYIGVATVNYNPNYGIQIWTRDGKIVRYNYKDAKAYNALHPDKKVVANDAKKLPGGTSWKVFNDKYTSANGTTYYNLGGNQYIDAAYVTLTPAK